MASGVQISGKKRIFFARMLHYSLLPARMFICFIMGHIISYIYKDKVPFKGLTFDTSSCEISPIIKAELYLRIYENGEIDLIQKHLPDCLDVIELGSSMGIVSTLVRKKLRRGFRLISVEAHPALTKQTKDNLKLNRLDYDVECLNQAVYYGPSSPGVFFTPGWLSRMGKLTYGAPRHKSILVESVTLSGLKNTFGINSFTLIADIEGVEAGIIREDKEALNHCQHLFLELHDTIHKGVAISAQDMLKELIDVHGFRLQARQGDVVYLNRG
jgi:FkbM family methyltransferase